MTAQAVWAPCAEHAEAMASFVCEGCERRLCYECVDEGKLVLCRHCGEMAVPFTAPAAEPGVPLSEPKILHREPSGSRASGVGDAGSSDGRLPILAAFMAHVVVPVALISMGYSFLSFLVEVRSVYFPGRRALNWLGFFFVVATVLIERSGRVSRRRVRQGVYGAALAGATALVLVVSPWESPGGSWQGRVLNGLIIFATWKLLTVVTGGVSREGEVDERPRGQRLYGLERITLERFQRQRGRGQSVRRQEEEAPAARRGPRPTVLVARLAVIALVVFALSERVLLAGVPEAGERGLTAMVVFFLATGMVLSASSFVELQRRLRRGGGRDSGEGLFGRVVVAFLLLIAVLSLALGLPGIRYQGRSELRPTELGVVELDWVRDVRDRALSSALGEDGGTTEIGGPEGEGQFRDPSPREAGMAPERRNEVDPSADAGEPPSLEEQRRLREAWGSGEKARKALEDSSRGAAGDRRGTGGRGVEKRSARQTPQLPGGSLLEFFGQLGKWLIARGALRARPGGLRRLAARTLPALVLSAEVSLRALAGLAGTVPGARPGQLPGGLGSRPLGEPRRADVHGATLGGSGRLRESPSVLAAGRIRAGRGAESGRVPPRPATPAPPSAGAVPRPDPALPAGGLQRRSVGFRRPSAGLESPAGHPSFAGLRGAAQDPGIPLAESVREWILLESRACPPGKDSRALRLLGSRCSRAWPWWSGSWVPCSIRP